MNCPKCHDKTLVQFSHEGIDFDFCSDGCKGIWCDKGELAYYLELTKDLPSERKLEHVGKKSHLCPSCHGQMWAVPYFLSKPSPDIDVCSGCKGIWLDFKELGELQKIAMNLEVEGKLSRTLKQIEQWSKLK